MTNKKLISFFFVLSLTVLAYMNYVDIEAVPPTTIIPPLDSSDLSVLSTRQDKNNESLSGAELKLGVVVEPVESLIDSSEVTLDTQDIQPVQEEPPAMKPSKLFSYLNVADVKHEIKDIFDPVFSTYGKPVGVDFTKLKSAFVGESFLLPNLESTFDIYKIESKKISTKGIHSIKLRHESGSRMHRAMLTLGEDISYGVIVSPTGSFEMRVAGNQGWLVDANYMRGPHDSAAVYP